MTDKTSQSSHEPLIVVTGGAGLIGSAFIWKCNQMGLHNILVVDNLASTEKWKNLVGLTYSDYIHKDTFFELLLQDKLSKNISAIIHMGACSATTEKNVDYLMENNFRYTRVLAEWCLQNEVRFIYASSAATYGNGEHGFLDDESTIDLLRPINPYGYSKQFFDVYAKRKGWLSGIAGVKFFNVFGPNEYHKGSMMSVVCKACPQIKQSGLMKLFKSYHPDYSDGGQMRDFVYVKDVVEVLWWLMASPKVNGIYNVGTGIARTWNDLANAIFSALNQTPNIHYIDMPEGLDKQYQYYTEASIDKLRAAGCPVKFRALEESVKDYVVNYLVEDRHLDSK